MNTDQAGNDPAIVKLFARLGGEVTEEMAKNTQNNKEIKCITIRC